MIDLKAIADYMKNFAQDATDFIYAPAMLCGIILSLIALKDIVNKGRVGGALGQEKSWGAIALRLAIASCLVTLAQKLEMMIATNGNVAPIKQALAYASGTASGSGSGPMGFIWAAISAWVVMMGVAGFFRGFLLFDKASQGQQDSGDLFWRGLWHVIGGALCVNIFS